MKLVTEDKVVLSSVGCVIDKSTGVTFPIHKDDTIDWDGCLLYTSPSPRD